MTVRKIFIRFCNNIRYFSNEINKRGGGILFCGGLNFSKSVSVGPTFIREMRALWFKFRQKHKKIYTECLIGFISVSFLVTVPLSILSGSGQ